ncbi:MAG: hypothetical protein M0Z30_19605 [Actinomycetota bacterium]|nr:hypothetical protein [Actinomycetota bacterium]
MEAYIVWGGLLVFEVDVVFDPDVVAEEVTPSVRCPVEVQALTMAERSSARKMYLPLADILNPLLPWPTGLFHYTFSGAILSARVVV